MARHTCSHYSATEAQQDEAYDHGFRSFDVRNGVYVNPYDSDRYWLLAMAYEQGWNDAVEAKRDQR